MTILNSEPVREKTMAGKSGDKFLRFIILKNI